MNKSIEERLGNLREFCPDCDTRVKVEIVPDLFTGEKSIRVYCPGDGCDYSEKPFTTDESP